MFTLREFYNEPGAKAGKGHTAPMPEPPAPELQTETLIINGAKRLVATMTEAHLTCNNRKCRGAQRCIGLNREDGGGACGAVMSKQRVDMVAAIVAFQACLTGAQKRRKLMQEWEEEARQTKEQELRKKREREPPWDWRNP
jgi:hypothetical protein